nr:hypothetical protein [Tanacetum cinerariifolium]
MGLIDSSQLVSEPGARDDLGYGCDFYGSYSKISHVLWKGCMIYVDILGNPHQALKDKSVIDSGCSRHMIGNISFLSDFEKFNRGYVAFGGNPKGGKISSKCKIKTSKLDFDDVYFVKELKFNIFSVPRENNMYNVDLKNIVPSGDLTCVFLNATLDESNLWHRRLGHINFKTMNKLVKGNLVRGLPSKIFETNHTCVACKKGKQHRASCKVGKETVSAQQYVLLPLWYTSSQDPQNTDDDAFYVKENENDVYVSTNGSDKTANKKHDEKAKRADKGKSPLDSPTGVRDLKAEFEEFSVNNTDIC